MNTVDHAQEEATRKIEASRGINYFSLIGKNVEFTATVESEYEIDFDAGMLARVIDVEQDHGDGDVLKIVVDHSDFFDHNRRLMKANYYDKDGRPRLTWEESGLMNANGRETIYVMADSEKHLPPFIVVDEVPISVEECLDILKIVHEAGNVIINNPPNEGWKMQEFKEKFSNAEQKARSILIRAKRL